MMQIQQTLCIHRRPKLLLELWTFLKEVFLHIQTWILSCQPVAHILTSHIGKKTRILTSVGRYAKAKLTSEF